MSDKFRFSYSAPTANERREIEDIKRQFDLVAQDSVTTGETKTANMAQLRKIYRRVTTPPRVVAYVIGVVGLLTFGGGMSLALEQENYLWGCIIGVVGIVVMSVNHLIFKWILKRNKNKYGQEIVNLCKELLNSEQ